MESTENTPPSSALEKAKNSTPQGQDVDFAFVVQSQDSSSQQTQPDADEQRLARQKRRRTSPQDQAILEAEYERNPKPDKSARMGIVNRVTLGEKEVQIWFQNRRQMTRRKSRPLLPHEVLSNFYSSQGYSSIAPSSSVPTTVSSQQQNSSTQGSHVSSKTTANSPPTTVPDQHVTDSPAATTVAALEQSSTADSLAEARGLHDGNCETVEGVGKSTNLESITENAQGQPANLIRSLSQTLPTKRRPGYFANRRSASFMIHDEASAPQLSVSNTIGQGNLDQNATSTSQSLKRTPSLVRLSLSLDGKAEVTTRTGTTPSPPRSQPASISRPVPRPNVGLQRSYSALEPSSKSAQGTNAIPFPRRPMTGRSRDSRTWEFYCDSDARNALTEQAEREESGSATAAISLIRSCSQKKKVMTTNPNKRNAYAQKPDSSKRVKADGQKPGKPKFSRATSSVARMQTGTTNATEQKLGTVSHHKSISGSQTELFQDADGDSDKENWEPGTQTRNPPRRRPANSQLAARVLEESSRVPSQSASLDALMRRENSTASRSSRKSSSSAEKENSGPEVDDEVAAFMGEPAPREVEDLDCVQNLLSLSQAAWR